MVDPDDREPGPGEDADVAVPAIVEAQLETARAEVFRAYVRSRDKARRLAAAELSDADERRQRPS